MEQLTNYNIHNLTILCKYHTDEEIPFEFEEVDGRPQLFIESCEKCLMIAHNNGRLAQQDEEED